MSLVYATLVKRLRRQSAKLVFSSSNLESSSSKDRITATYNILIVQKFELNYYFGENLLYIYIVPMIKVNKKCL